MSKKNKIKDKGKKLIIGHLWDDNGGWCYGWTGCNGTQTCKRCLASFHYLQKSGDKPKVFDKMWDCSGKKVPKTKWHICPADKLPQNETSGKVSR